MTIYFFLVAAILLLNYARRRQAVSDKAFCRLVCILFILVAGLRHNTVGSDTTGYYLAFHRLHMIPLRVAVEARDFGYQIFEWVLARLGLPFEVLTLLAAVAFYIPVFLLIFRHSKNKGLSCLVLMAFNFFQFSMTGIRQTFAIGFAVLFFLELFEEHPRYFRAILYIAIGIMMHRSCVVALLYFPIKLLSKKTWTNYVILVLLPVSFFLRTRVSAFSNLFETIGFDLTDFQETGGGLTTYLVFLILFLWGVFFTAKRDQEENSNGMKLNYLTLTGISALLQPLVMVNSIFFRIVWYFSLYLTIYIPALVETSRVTRKSRVLIELLLYLGLLYMYFGITIGSAHVTPYHFFWQGA